MNFSKLTYLFVLLVGFSIGTYQNYSNIYTLSIMILLIIVMVIFIGKDLLQLRDKKKK
ncbi:hypothetical protein SAMN04487944_109126 [Gracilibacillus ureilyticus]|uniref:Uncharacterized protein n=1 Tax=Gracilibacillus ureilyticus TaxID=531814 RepID=A0A1H9RRX1_9BACI|nr:hypothetical protein SAMN04487944_109126 [Gracilibacillus ureilyticus]